MAPHACCHEDNVDVKKTIGLFRARTRHVLRSLRSTIFAGLCALIPAASCGTTDTPIGAQDTSVAPGRECAGVGSTVPAEDGCNSCTCDSSRHWSCTEMECRSKDAANECAPVPCPQGAAFSFETCRCTQTDAGSTTTDAGSTPNDVDSTRTDAGTPTELACDDGGTVTSPGWGQPRCLCQAGSAAELERSLDSSCASAVDPFIAALVPCPGCHYAGAVIVVGNRGGEPLAAGLRILLSMDGTNVEPAVLPWAVEPGGLSMPFEFQRDFFGQKVTATLDYTNDCNGGNNSATTDLYSLGCL